MHWYLYSIKGTYANMLLDHNITEANSAAGVWALEADYTAGLTATTDGDNNVTGYQIGEGTGSKATSAGITYPSSVTSFGVYSSNKNARGPVTALNTLKSLTSGWIAGTPKVPNASNTNEHIIPSSANNNQYQIDYGYVDGNGIGYHARLITYTEAGYLGCTTIPNSCPEWMISNLYTSSTTSLPYGYWTSSPYDHNSNDAWRVYSNRLSSFTHADYTGYGVRPVITVQLEDIL